MTVYFNPKSSFQPQLQLQTQPQSAWFAQNRIQRGIEVEVKVAF